MQRKAAWRSERVSEAIGSDPLAWAHQVKCRAIDPLLIDECVETRVARLGHPSVRVKQVSLLAVQIRQPGSARIVGGAKTGACGLSARRNIPVTGQDRTRPRGTGVRQKVA